MKKPSVRTDLRIFDQKRNEQKRSYHLACEGTRLLIEIGAFPQGEPAEWRVEARVRAGSADATSGDTIANETAATRTEALRAVARTWRSREPEHGIRVFDWEAVEALLESVQAL